MRHAVKGWSTWTLAFCGFMLMYLPVLATIYLSFHETTSQGQTGWTLTPYIKTVNHEDLSHAFRVSFGIAILSSCVTVGVGICAALVTWRGPRILQRLILGSMAVLLVIPDLVLGIGLLMWYGRLGFPSGPSAILFAHATASLALVVMTLTSRLKIFDQDILDAARDLGAKPAQVLLYVILPVLAPGILGSAMLAFTYSFDDFILGFLLGSSGSESATLYVTLYAMTRMHQRSEAFALGVLMMVPVFAGVLFKLVPVLGRSLMRK
jgi:spermidine/putrescine transport system permease protein